MSVDIFLLILRFLGAGLLLAFVGSVAWLIYRDMQLTAVALARQSEPLGYVRVLSSENGNGDMLPLLPLTSIGRSNTNLIILEDAFASNEHALIMRRGEQWWLEDLGSRNGTLLNDVTLAETAVVSPGDVITIGNTRLKIEL